MTEVHPQHRHIGLEGVVAGPEERPVSPEHEHEFTAGGGHRGFGHGLDRRPGRDLRARLLERADGDPPLSARLDDLGDGGHDVGTPEVGYQQDSTTIVGLFRPVHCGPSSTATRIASSDSSVVPTGSPARARRRCRKYSTFPDGPGSGLATHPRVVRPSSRAARATPTTASSRSAGSRTTPPLPTRSRPTSNWGLIIGSRSPPGRAQRARAGRTSLREMNDRSPTTRSTSPPMSRGSSERTLV